MTSDDLSIQPLAPGDVALMQAMLTLFGEAFDEVESYGKARPSAAYVGRLLGSDYFIALAALKGEDVLHFDIPVTEPGSST